MVKLLSSPIRILLVEDNQGDARLIKEMLAEAGKGIFSFFCEPALAEGMKRAESQELDLILLDLGLPDSLGLETIMKARAVVLDLPIVVLTGLEDEEVALEAVRLGAQDYLVKDKIDYNLLAQSIRYAIERKKVDAALRESEERYRIITENVSDTVWLMDMNFKTSYISPSVVRTRGFTLEEIQALPLEKNFSPASMQTVIQLIGEELTPERLGSKDLKIERTRELEFCRKDGSLYWSEVTLTLIRDRGGKPTGFVGVGRDITERKQAEETLKQSEEKFRVLTEKSIAGIFIIQDGKLAYVNQSFAKTFGYSPEEIIDPRSPKELIHPDDIQAVMRSLRERLEGKTETSNMVYKAIKRDGSLIYIEVYSMVIDYQGRPAVMGTLMDITERRQAEETRTKLESELRQAQKMEAVGQLAGGVAHDFNNNLTPIFALCDLNLKELEPGNPLREDLAEIKEAAERCTVLVRQLMAFSHKQILDPKIINLNEVIVNMEKMLKRSIREDIKLEKTLAPDLGMVKADIGQFEQILINLAVNARDALPEGGKLTLETSNVLVDEEFTRDHTFFKPGPYVLMAVSDTGVGMDQETKARIFEPFFTTKEKGKGTGLGLATVYGIVKQSGGNILVESEPGKGATFKIYLPVTTEKATHWIDQKKAPLNLSNRHETILLVEDENGVRSVLERILGKLGYQVLPAESGEEALKLAENTDGKIDLLITDVIMTGMSGKVLAETLKKNRKDLKVIFISGYAGDALNRHGVLEPGILFVQKPFTTEALISKIDEALK